MAKPKQGFPRWLSWMVIAFLLYAGYSSFQNKRGERIEFEEAEQNACDCHPSLPLMSPLFAMIKSLSAVKLLVLANQPKCGQTALVDVTATLPDGSAYEAAASNRRFHLRRRKR